MVMQQGFLDSLQRTQPVQQPVQQLVQQPSPFPPPASPQQAIADRASTAAQNRSWYLDPTLDMRRRIRALNDYMTNTGLLKMRYTQTPQGYTGAGPDYQGAYSFFKTLPLDLQQAYSAQADNPDLSLFGGQTPDPKALSMLTGPRWWRGEFARPVSGAGTAPNLPQRGALNVLDPGAYLAQMLRNQIPGYVMNTRVPRPADITLSDWLKLNPTQRDVLTAFWSAIGIRPEDAAMEMARFWLGGTPVQNVRYRA